MCRFFLCCKHKTAYGMLISDWSSDVCSSGLLTSVQGVGGRVALAILSALETAELHRAVAMADKAMIGRANGVGPKLAARIVNELKDKIGAARSEEHTSELQSLMRNSYAVLCLKKNNTLNTIPNQDNSML